MSGPHPSGIPNEAIKHADSVLLGRGEISWLKLLKDLENNNLKQFYDPIRPSENLKIPFTNVKLPGFVIIGAIEATRGCPYKCSFCPESANNNASYYYKRPIAEVISEIKSIPQKFLMFYDASLTIDREYSKTLFGEMVGLSKKFLCNGNSDVLANDEELVKLSRKAGCLGWLIGFESISQKTLNGIGKKTNKVDDYFRAVKNIHKHKMAVIGCFMFGFDTDTPNVFEETLDEINNLKIDVADFTIVTPLPGTPLFDRLENEDVVFQPKNMTPQELIDGVNKMYKEFYSTKNTLKRIVRSAKLGIYPFFTVVGRNLVANMNRRLLK